MSFKYHILKEKLHLTIKKYLDKKYVFQCKIYLLKLNSF